MCEQFFTWNERVLIKYIYPCTNARTLGINHLCQVDKVLFCKTSRLTEHVWHNQVMFVCQPELG